jgi:outer membrane protein assembly factor BamD
MCHGQVLLLNSLLKFSNIGLWPRVRAALMMLGAVIIVAACTSGPAEVEYVEQPVEDLYNEALDLLQAEDYLEAVNAFDEVERLHPYSIWATRAQLMVAFAHYQQGNFDDTILAAERFLQLHPGSPEAPYAHYLAAISFYDQIVDVGRDQAMTEMAMYNLEQVVLRYPETDYARDARLKIDLAREHLAGKEMEVGRFYLNRRRYVAAINRFRTVVDEFQTTSHVPEALHRLTESYLSLGVTEEAQAAAAVLGYNFPGSEWYELSYQLLTVAGVNFDATLEDPGFLERALDLFKFDFNLFGQREG